MAPLPCGPTRPGTVAARPDTLAAFAARTLAATEVLHQRTVALAIAASGAGANGWAPPAVDGLLVRLRHHRRDSARLARRTSEVGAAFLRAGGGPAGGRASPLGEASPGTRPPIDAASALLAAALRLPPPAGTRTHAGGAEGEAIRPSPVDPDTVARLAAALGPVLLGWIAAVHPELVGPIDGMPVAARYRANRALVARAVAAAETTGATSRAARLRPLLAPGRQLLLVDPTGDGRVVEVVGDLDAARSIAVVVPGMANGLANFTTTLAKAEAIVAAATAAGASGTAAVAWLGYDSPGVLGAPLDDAARAGADRLRSLADALPATARRTVVAHSYGTVLTGLALRRGLEVDQVVVTGSPGMLGPTAAAVAGAIPVYAARAPFDAVGWSENFGPDPTDPRFGAHRLDTGSLWWHSGYFAPGSESLAAIAGVVTGQTDAARRLSPGLAEQAIVAIDAGQRLTTAPLDLVQRAGQAAAGRLDAGAERLEAALPRPVAGVVDTAQGLGRAGAEYGSRFVDLTQRLSSPDLYGDVALDAWAVASERVPAVAPMLAHAVEAAAGALAGEVHDVTWDIGRSAAEQAAGVLGALAPW